MLLATRNNLLVKYSSQACNHFIVDRLTSGEGMDGVRSRVPSMAVTDKDDKHSRGVTNENIARNNSTDNIPIVSPADQMESEVLKDSTGSSINKVEKSSNSEEKVEETVVNSDNNKETESDSLALPPISPRPDGGSTKVNGIGFNATPRSGKTMITPVSGSGKRLISPSITSGKVSASAGSLPKISANSSNYYKDSSPGTENKAGNRRRSFPFNFRPKTSDSKNANGVKTTNKEGNSGPKSSTGRSLQTKDEIQNAQQIAKDAIDNASNLSAGDETKRRHSLSSTPVLPKLETPKYSERTKVSTEPVSVVSKNENVDLECDAGQTVDQAVAKQINSVGVGAVNVAGSERKDQYINIEETAVNEEAIARESVASVAGPSTSTRNEEVKTEQVDSVENRKDVEGMASTTVSSTSQEVMKNVTEGEML